MNPKNANRIVHLSTGDVARDLNLSIGTVQTMVNDGRLEAWRTDGGHRRICATSLESYKARVNFKNVTSTPKEANFIGFLLTEKQNIEFNFSENSKISGLRCKKYSSMLDVLCEYDKTNICFLIADYELMKNNSGLQLLKFMNDKLPDNFFTLLLTPEKLDGHSLAKLNKHKKVLILPRTPSFFWLAAFIHSLKECFLKDNLNRPFLSEKEKITRLRPFDISATVQLVENFELEALGVET
jgi:excisionase family DNA binding protein